MNTTLTRTGLVVAMLALAACSRHEPGTAANDHGIEGTIHLGSLGIDTHTVTIHRDGYPDARISDAGRLTIGDRDIPVTESQRSQLLAYHAAAMQLREHGKDTGIAGAKAGAAAVGAVISGLVKGEPDSIGPKVEAKVADVKESARQLCDDIADMRKAQDALATEVEAFRPYATLKAKDESDCREGLDD